jgi:hypothetical protein
MVAAHMARVTLGSRAHMGRGNRVSVYLLVCAVVTVVAVFAYGETRTRDLAADHAVVPKTEGRSVERV